VDRLVQHLVKLGHWSDEEQAALEAETKRVVDNALKEANSFGTLTEPPFLDAHLMFEDVFREMPDHLRKQRDEMLELTGEIS
jgi:2-oxoisovalerate dehydrogenase E1 component alpha subunit